MCNYLGRLFCKDIWMLEVWKIWRCVKHEQRLIYVYLYIYIYIHQYLYVPSLSLRWTGNKAHMYILGMGVLDRMMWASFGRIGYGTVSASYRSQQTCLHLPVLDMNQCVPHTMFCRDGRLYVFLIFLLLFLLGHHLPALWNLTKPSSFPHFRWAKDEIIWRRNSLKNDQDASQFVLRGSKDVSIFRYI